MSHTLPHIIVFLSDQHQGQAMSHRGDPNVRTPAMDRMTAQGVSCATAFANCPVCVPSRGTIFSGRHAHAGPVQGFNDVWKPTAPGMAHLLRRLGYHTAYFGKWHLGVTRDQYAVGPDGKRLTSMARTPEPLRAGFQDWHAFENGGPLFDPIIYHNADVLPTRHTGYDSDVVTEMALDYLKTYDKSQPLLLVVSVVPPHFPLVVPDRWKRFDPKTLTVRDNFTDIPEMRAALATYLGMVENVDWNLGRLLDAVDALPGFTGNSLCAYISDHGEFMGSHGRQSRKEHPHEESVRIPAIFRGPSLPARGTVAGIFGLVDFLPTILGLIGQTPPAHVQGRDCSAWLRGQDACPNQDVLLEMCGVPRHALDFRDWRAIRTNDWKYAFYEDATELLFNLATDPFELHNLAAIDPENKSRMRSLLLRRLAETREPYFDVLMEHGIEHLPVPLDVSAQNDGWTNHPHPAGSALPCVHLPEVARKADTP